MIDIEQLEHSEKVKYIARHKGKYLSQVAVPFAEYLKEIVSGSCLEIGCGVGATMDCLMDVGIESVGLDITLKGIIHRRHNLPVFEAPVWDMPFEDKSFDFTFSTDVLEHIPPELVDRSIEEIIRVTKIKTIHQIACFDMHDDHLTVREISWWKEKFLKFSLRSDITERKI